jgi:hypothetical protein
MQERRTGCAIAPGERTETAVMKGRRTTCATVHGEEDHEIEVP